MLKKSGANPFQVSGFGFQVKRLSVLDLGAEEVCSDSGKQADDILSLYLSLFMMIRSQPILRTL
jgi:hypothetical protein